MQRITFLFTLAIILAVVGITWWVAHRSRIAKPEQQPVCFLLGIAVDVSRSFEALLPETKRALSTFLDCVRPGDRVVLVIFCDLPQCLFAGKVRSQTDLEVLKNIVANLTLSERQGTSQVAGYNLLLSEMSRLDSPEIAKRFVIVCSDSYQDLPDGRPRPWERIRLDAIARGMTLRLLFYNNRRDADFIKLLTANGIPYRVYSPQESIYALKELAAEVSWLRTQRWEPPSSLHLANTSALRNILGTVLSSLERSLALAHHPYAFLALLALVLLVSASVVAVLRGYARKERERLRVQLQTVTAAPDRPRVRRVIRLSSLDRSIQRPLQPNAVITFGTGNEFDLALHDPTNARIAGRIRVSDDGSIFLRNLNSTFPFEIGDHRLPPGSEMELVAEHSEIRASNGRVVLNFEVKVEAVGEKTPRDLLKKYGEKGVQRV